MYSQSQDDESWQRQAVENGWTPPKTEEEKDPAGIGGYQKFVLLILAVIVLSTWWGKRKDDQPTKAATTKETTAQTSTKTTVLPGSAREAVMNGELDLADIQHRADAIGWSTDAWQKWYYIANQTGTSMEAVEKAAVELNKRLEEEPPEFVEGLNALGISMEEAKAMKPEELFEKVIYGLQEIED